jgi:hypothetical protein
MLHQILLEILVLILPEVAAVELVKVQELEILEVMVELVLSSFAILHKM